MILFIGGGIGLYLWEYAEAGDFVIDRNSNPTIVSGRAFSDGSDFGFHVHGGIQIPFSHSAVIYTQVKHSWVEDDISEDFVGHLNRSIFR